MSVPVAGAGPVRAIPKSAAGAIEVDPSTPSIAARPGKTVPLKTARLSVHDAAAARVRWRDESIRRVPSRPVATMSIVRMPGFGRVSPGVSRKGFETRMLVARPACAMAEPPSPRTNDGY